MLPTERLPSLILVSRTPAPRKPQAWIVLTGQSQALRAKLPIQQRVGGSRWARKAPAASVERRGFLEGPRPEAQVAPEQRAAALADLAALGAQGDLEVEHETHH